MAIFSHKLELTPLYFHISLTPGPCPHKMPIYKHNYACNVKLPSPAGSGCNHLIF